MIETSIFLTNWSSIIILGDEKNTVLDIFFNLS